MTSFDYVNIIATTLFALIIFYPFYNSVLVSFTSQADYVKTPFMLFPRRIVLDSYRVVFNSKVIFTGLKVTFIITVFGVIYNMLLTVSLAYGFNKQFPGRKVLLYMVIFTMYFSGGLIPFYLLIKNMGLINNIASMILPTGVSIPYMVVMRKYFAALPEELEESAKLDGASELVILARIILPLSLPMIVTFALYYGVERWNEWWLGMLFVQDPYLQPLQLVLRGIIQSTGAVLMSSNLQEAGIIPYSDGIKMASIVVTMLPVAFVYPFLQKYFVQGLAIGALKG